MQLAILTAVLAAIASAETGDGPVVGIAWRLLVVVSSTLVAPLAALVGSHRLVATLADDEQSEDAASRLQTIVVGLWLGTVAIILLVAKWPSIVRGNWGLADWPLVDELAILLPVIAPLLMVWAAQYRLERAAQFAACKARQIEPPPARLMSYLWLNVRHQLALVLLPPLLVVGLFEALTSLKIAAVDLDIAWWFMLPLVGMMLVLMPAAVRRIWQTTSLGGPLRERLDDVCRLRKCSVRDILIWHTDGTMANAAVVGISRWLRYLLLTDVLVARLSDDEIAAVVRHELAHLRRWHLPLRLAVLLLPVAWWLAVKQAWPGIGPLFESTIVSLGVRPAIVAAFGVPVGMVTYAVVVVGWYSRLLEHDADLDASITDGGQLDAIMATDFCRALLTLCGRARESWFSQWLHPPVAARVEFLQRVIFEPTDAVTFRRRLNSVTLAMAVLYVAAMLVAAL
jgi:STE24 endopeptidase